MAESLRLEERVSIEVGVARGLPARVIAAGLGRATSTVTRELKRRESGCYSATVAQAIADSAARRPRARRLAVDSELAAHVTARLQAKDSPMTISVELQLGVFPGVAGRVSTETIYQAVYHPTLHGLAKGLHHGLHRRHRCRKHRRPAGETLPVKGPLGVFNLIHTRPAEAAGRTVAGHIEGDLVVGSFNRSAVITLNDRMSRKTWLATLPEGHSAEQVLAGLFELTDRIGPVLKTITWDQGREMARHHDLARLADIAVFFCDPHAPWQRPTNENGNGLLRRYIGKGTNLNLITDTTLTAIEHRINTIPRRIHHWHTANHVYDHAVALTA